jgi:hypothetical protein
MDTQPIPGDIVQVTKDHDGDRTPHPCIGRRGVVAYYKPGREGVMSVVAFKLPMRDLDGGTWLASEDEQYFFIGYYPGEIQATGQRASRSTLTKIKQERH